MNIESIMADVSHRCRDDRERTRFEAAKFVVHRVSRTPHLVPCCIDHEAEHGFIMYNMLPVTYQIGVMDPDTPKLSKYHVPYLSPCCYNTGHTRSCALLMALFSLAIVT